MKKFVMVVGAPGTGKTTLMKNVLVCMGALQKEQHTQLIPSWFSEQYKTHVLGLYDLESTDVFQGTDKLSMACQRDLPQLLECTKSHHVLLEGDRLFTNTTVDSVMEKGWDLRILHLNVPRFMLDERYRARGSNQSSSFLESRHTKIDNILSRFDLLDKITTAAHTSPACTETWTDFILKLLKE